MQKEIFVSSARLTGDLAGVFEYDGETGHFYLYRTKGAGGTKIIGSLHIISGPLEIARDDISIHWDDSETKVARS
jgi:hypothetical protein